MNKNQWTKLIEQLMIEEKTAMIKFYFLQLHFFEEKIVYSEQIFQLVCFECIERAV